jgi:hypothetical protein
MAKRYITTLLSERLGEYLDGLDSTDVKFTMSEATLQMENVSFKENALRRLKLPITIKHGLVRRLDVSNSVHTCLGPRSMAQHLFGAGLNHV